MPKPICPPIGRIRQRLRYCPDTGNLYWLPIPVTRPHDAQWNSRYSGTVALATVTSKGYLQGHLEGFRLQAHRVAWALHQGEWPPEQIDHINRDRQDNRIVNLRAVTPSENMFNRDVSTRKLGLPRGVRWVEPKKRFYATISTQGRKKHLGSFPSADAASVAYEAALATLKAGVPGQ